MKYLFTIVSLFLFFWSNAQNDDTLDILFVGNSITYFNNMPQTFKEIALEKGEKVRVDQHTPGGTGFVNHVQSQQLFTKLQSKTWDIVVLQPGSNESPGFSFPITETIERAKILKDSILTNNPCTDIYFYEISYGIVSNTPASYTQYNERQDLINANLKRMSDSTAIPVIPAGECIRERTNTNQSDFLWGGYNDIHPNAKGSYIIANAMYTSIFKRKVYETPIITGCTTQEAITYNNLVDDYVLNRLDEWRISNYSPIAEYDFLINPTQITLISTSNPSDSIHWFVDDIFESNVNPFTTNYISFSEYKLINYLGCKTHETRVGVNITSASILEYNVQLNIYPNPVTEVIYIQSNQRINKVILIDLTGKLVLESNFDGDAVNLKVNGIKPGNYILSIQNGKSIVTKRVQIL